MRRNAIPHRLRSAPAVSMSGAGLPPAKGQDRRPNIVFLLVDNVGWGTFGVYGGTTTPRIDGMASEGIGFTNYKVEAQCTPTPALSRRI
jgi:hypothetical protein